MVKLKGKDIALIAIAAVMIVVIAAFGFPSPAGSGGQVTTTMIIDFEDSDAPLNPGNRTTWEMVGGSWKATTESNANHSVWVFKNVTSGSNCYLQLLAASSIGGFQVATDNQTLGMLVTSIAGLTNQLGGGPGWQFWVNGVYANRSCNQIGIEDGDTVEWRYKPLEV
jgi:hypothetical protein